MAKWHFEIDLTQTWKNSEELGPTKVAAALADELEKLNIKDEDIQSEKSDLVEQLRSLAEDDLATFDDFDCLLECVYDWADQYYKNGKLCWIRTF